jgi:hypothetical protein
MIQVWLLFHILFLIITVTTAENVALRTRQGIIYGRQTQSSIEYLGYKKSSNLIKSFPLISIKNSICKGNSMETTS